MKELRLQKFLAHSGVASRRKAEELIVLGRVKVNERIITELGAIVGEGDIIKIDDKEIQREKKIYVIINKPSGIITSVKDQFNRTTVIDLLKEYKEYRLYPVGRLDYDTEGLLLITNDGDLTNGLLHPKYKIPKTYFVILNKPIKQIDIKSLENGIELEDGPTQPAKVKIIDKNKVEITITEGRNRQVRRMFEHMGYNVVKLIRIKFSFLTIEGLATGQYRELKEGELKKIKLLLN